jgi:hypothetical protein
LVSSGHARRPPPLEGRGGTRAEQICPTDSLLLATLETLPQLTPGEGGLRAAQRSDGPGGAGRVPRNTNITHDYPDRAVPFAERERVHYAHDMPRHHRVYGSFKQSMDLASLRRADTISHGMNVAKFADHLVCPVGANGYATTDQPAQK